MSDPVNETFENIVRYSRKPKTKKLYAKLFRAVDEQEYGVIISALSQLLVETHSEIQMRQDGGICIPCANGNLTQLLQSIRKMHDEVMARFPEEEDRCEHRGGQK